MKIIFASANKNKIAEIGLMLEGKFEILGLKDIGIVEEIPELGATIKENSFLKANYVFNFLKERNQPEIAVFADDSGLEVVALNNSPGVYSARYAGEPRNDDNNNKKLLNELNNITNRKARFVTIITLIMNNKVQYFEGEIKGTVGYEAKGYSGFGYDPLFIPRGYRSTIAELGAKVKNTISHRALAVKQMVALLENINPII